MQQYHADSNGIIIIDELASNFRGADEILTEGESATPCNSDNSTQAVSGSFVCDANYSLCMEKWEGPNFGITSFDNIGFAMLTVFQYYKCTVHSITLH